MIKPAHTYKQHKEFRKIYCIGLWFPKFVHVSSHFLLYYLFRAFLSPVSHDPPPHPPHFYTSPPFLTPYLRPCFLPNHSSPLQWGLIHRTLTTGYSLHLFCVLSVATNKRLFPQPQGVYGLHRPTHSLKFQDREAEG